MNLVIKEYQRKAHILLENWQAGEVFSSLAEPPSTQTLASMIDAAILVPEASISAVNKVCKTALQYQLGGVCVNPMHVPRCVALLGSDLPVATVVGFPLGANQTRIKAAEAELASEQGARVIQMVLNVGLLKTSNFQEVFEDIRAVRLACAETELRLILETGLLNPMEIIIACMLAREAGADDVMTSTGFSRTGATVEDVSLMRAVLDEDLGILASGITIEKESAAAAQKQLLTMIEAGASRLSLDTVQDQGILAALFDQTA